MSWWRITWKRYLSAHRTEPVSYTHLDVYKRQSPQQMSFVPCDIYSIKVVNKIQDKYEKNRCVLYSGFWKIPDLENALCSKEVSRVITGWHTACTHAVCWRSTVEHTAAAKVNPDVADRRTGVWFKVNQIARLQGINVLDCFPTGNFGITGGAQTACRDACIFETVVYKAGAVIRIWSAGTIRIRFPQLCIANFYHCLLYTSRCV